MSMNAAKAIAGLTLVAAAGLAANMAPASSNSDPYSNLPSTLTLTGTVRDFKAREQAGGHTDFEWQPTAGYAHYMQMVQDNLDSERKPQFLNTGKRVNSNWRDAAGRNRISNKEYINSKSGDTNGSLATAEGGSSHTSAAFAQWYRDVPGTNVSKLVPITLTRQSNSNMYTFNVSTDSAYATLGGFFPINGELYGNYGNTNKNFGFTYELATNFIYERGKGQVFTFTGDDDVWVFIDGKLVIDIGGVHSAVSQSIELDRLNWLIDGREYSLNFFFAERHTSASNFRIDTTLKLRNIDPPATSGLYD